MEQQPQKCVMVIDERLPLGFAANTAAILGITLGRRLPQAVGKNVCDAAGREHLGIIEFPVPILRGSTQLLYALREKLYAPEFRDLTAADFTSLAQGCGTYEEYVEKMARAPGECLAYLGLAICGEKKKVNRLTGSLPLLR